MGRGKLVTRYYHLRRVMAAAGLIQKQASEAGVDSDEDDFSKHSIYFH